MQPKVEQVFTPVVANLANLTAKLTLTVCVIVSGGNVGVLGRGVLEEKKRWMVERGGRGHLSSGYLNDNVITFFYIFLSDKVGQRAMILT